MAPTIGALTTGFFGTQASATWAIETPRSAAIRSTAPMISALPSPKKRLPTGSMSPRVV